MTRATAPTPKTSAPSAPAQPARGRDVVLFLRDRLLMVFVIVGLALGVTLWALDQQTALAVTAYTVLVVVIGFTAVEMVRDLLGGHWGLDVLAVIAMVATLVVQEYLAGLIIALMLTGGEALEALAERRATRNLDMLLD